MRLTILLAGALATLPVDSIAAPRQAGTNEISKLKRDALEQFISLVRCRGEVAEVKKLFDAEASGQRPLPQEDLDKANERCEAISKSLATSTQEASKLKRILEDPRPASSDAKPALDNKKIITAFSKELQKCRREFLESRKAAARCESESNKLLDDGKGGKKSVLNLNELSKLWSKVEDCRAKKQKTDELGGGCEALVDSREKFRELASTTNAGGECKVTGSETLLYRGELYRKASAARPTPSDEAEETKDIGGVAPAN